VKRYGEYGHVNKYGYVRIASKAVQEGSRDDYSTEQILARDFATNGFSKTQSVSIVTWDTHELIVLLNRITNYWLLRLWNTSIRN